MLQRWNVAMTVLHAAQAVAVVVLANEFTIPVTGSFLEGPPGTLQETQTLFETSLAWGVAGFFFLSSIFHLLVAGPFRARYRAGLDRGRNNFRWVEYSLSASLMIVLIALLTGITDIAALIALFGVNASMIFFGAIQEKYEEPGGSLLPFWLGSVAGIVPWLAIGVYLVSPGTPAEPPGFVYGIFVSLFVFFNSFAINQWLQYRQVGRWASYQFGERSYMVLSLAAKSALGWQVFGGTLAG